MVYQHYKAVLINKKKADKDLPKEFIHNGSTVDNPEQNANLFNEYFTNLGPNLEKKTQEVKKIICKLGRYLRKQLFL